MVVNDTVHTSRIRSAIRTMNTLTIRTKFTFGDRVRFDSATQKRTGFGSIFAIMIDKYEQITYMIDTSVGEYTDILQPAILEHEITLIENEKPTGK